MRLQDAKRGPLVTTSTPKIKKIRGGITPPRTVWTLINEQAEKDGLLDYKVAVLTELLLFGSKLVLEDDYRYGARERAL